MDIIFCLLAIYGLTYLIRQSDGPFGIIAWARNILMRNKYFGVLFYKLFSCPFCTGIWSGAIIYLIYNLKINHHLMIWSLAGGAFCLFLEIVINKLSN